MVMTEPESVTITLPHGFSSWEAVLEYLNDVADDGYVYMKKIARSLDAQLPKPKPEEPKNAGAILRHAGRFLWAYDGEGWWVPVKGSGDPARYDDFPLDVEILFEGVPE